MSCQFSSRLGAVIAAGLFAASSLTGCELEDELTDHQTETETETSVETQLIRVIDGDTLAVEPVDGVLEPTNDAGDEHSVRLLGIDAAEMNFYSDEEPECGAQQATDFLNSQLAAGEPVTLEFDAAADDFDQYDRALAYVSTEQIDDIALEVVEAGWAEAWYPPSAPEPSNYQDYEAGADEAASVGAGAHSACESIGR